MKVPSVPPDPKPPARRRPAWIVAVVLLVGCAAGSLVVVRDAGQVATVEAPAPYRWSAMRVDAGHIETSGRRPPGADVPVLAARLPTHLALIDRATPAPGAPAGFPEAAAHALAALAYLAPGGRATLTATRLSLAGETVDAAAWKALQAHLAARPAGYDLDNGAVSPAAAALRFSVERKLDRTLELGGQVASSEIRAALLAAARQAGDAVEDRLEIAEAIVSGPDPTELGRFVLGVAALLREGRVAFGPAGLSVDGQILDPQARDEIEAALRTPPAGVTIATVALRGGAVAPYAFRIRRADEVVSLAGHLPDAQARQRLLGLIGAEFLREEIRDRTRLAEGAPEGLPAAVAAALPLLATLARGELAVSDRTLTLTGEGHYPESARRAAATLPRVLPEGWSAVAELGPRAVRDPDAQACAQDFAGHLRGRTLRFEAGSIALRPDFYPVLDALANHSRTCRTGRIEVVGHGDPLGTPPAPETTASLADLRPEAPANPKAPKPEGVKSEAGKSESSKSEGGRSGTARPGEPAGTKAKGDKARTDPAHGTAAVKTPDPASSAGSTEVATPTGTTEDLARLRALAVVEYLQQAGVDAGRVSALPVDTPSNDREGVSLVRRP